ncbi:SDR family oxidoreductase [Streptomyces montanus]|uniref:SDR family oxidoreductase n=1 Tax=Streptomyces montanus TaxID=2580423 RepID=A0A5R9G2E4_9ACTN|nr:SDR family oxidoreductase [Streptomyces montanus]TLS47014.1 SDR family oxidoreductase [Streptomyces montanus]
MDTGLTGAKALVTGASRGIGRAIARTLAAEGCSLALCARGEEALEKAAAELRADGATVFAEPVDVTDPAALAGFVQRSADELGGLDLLVSNVSAGNVKGPESWEASLHGDLLPFAGLVEAALPHLERSDRASVVVIGTTNASDTARPAGANSYSAIKAAVVQHASALAHALAPKGIRVNTVSPGPIEFPGGAWETIRTGRPEVYEEVLGKLPIGRYGTPEDVAAAVTFLLGRTGSFCVGVNLVVDGGLLTRVQY